MSGDIKDLQFTDKPRDLVDTPFPIEDSFSPVLHRVNAAIRSRAIKPNDPIPPPAKILTQFSQPPEHVLQNAERHLKKLIEVADVKKGTLKHQTPPCVYNKSNQNSTTKSQRPQTRTRARETPLRPGRRRPPHARKARQDLTEQRSPRVQADSRAGGEHRDDQGRCQTDAFDHRRPDPA